MITSNHSISLVHIGCMMTGEQAPCWWDVKFLLFLRYFYFVKLQFSCQNWLWQREKLATAAGFCMLSKKKTWLAVWWSFFIIISHWSHKKRAHTEDTHLHVCRRHCGSDASGEADTDTATTTCTTLSQHKWPGAKVKSSWICHAWGGSENHWRKTVPEWMGCECCITQCGCLFPHSWWDDFHRHAQTAHKELVCLIPQLRETDNDTEAVNPDVTPEDATARRSPENQRSRATLCMHSRQYHLEKTSLGVRRKLMR